MSERTCSIDGCCNRVLARGWCDKHYRRWKVHGDPNHQGYTLSRDGVCSVEGCERPIRSRRLCSPHYKQAQYAAAKQAELPKRGTCVECSREFAMRRAGMKYCTETCQKAAAAGRERTKRSEGRTWSCDHCGADISHMRSDARYCSDHCSNRVDYQENRARIDAYSREYTRRNKDKIAKRKRAYRDRHRDELYAQQRVWIAANLERHKKYQREYAKRWSAQNRHKGVLYVNNRRKRIRENRDSVKIAVRDWERMLRRFDYCCAYCGNRPRCLQMEHVIPLSRGGRHAIGNVLPACQPCNRAKSDRLLTEWRFSQSFKRKAVA